MTGRRARSVRLLDDEATFEPPLAPGEVLNVTGVVAERDVGGWEVLARSEALVRASSLSLPTRRTAARRTPRSVVAVIGRAESGDRRLPCTPCRRARPGRLIRLRLGLALAVAPWRRSMVVIGGVLMTRPLRRRGSRHRAGPVRPRRRHRPTDRAGRTVRMVRLTPRERGAYRSRTADPVRACRVRSHVAQRGPPDRPASHRSPVPHRPGTG